MIIIPESSSRLRAQTTTPSPAATARPKGLKTGCVTIGSGSKGGGLLLGRSAATTFGSDESRAAQSTPSFSTNVTIEFGPTGVWQEGPNATSAPPSLTSRRSPAKRGAPVLTSAKPTPRDKSTVPLAEVRRAEGTEAHVLFACISHRPALPMSSANAALGRPTAQI